MNVIKEIEKGIKNCKWLLENDVANAKEHKAYYSDEVDVLIEANEKFLNMKTIELQTWCEVSVIAWDMKQKGIKKFKRKILTWLASEYIDRIERDMLRAGKAREELKKIRSRFDGFLYLTK
ncbi:MAG: hypothetical protein J6M60_01185 [Clostridia bacterium]|nr:hypothetical protein [Clostridia bacterium]